MQAQHAYHHQGNCFLQQRKWEATEEAKGTFRPLPATPGGLPDVAAELPKTVDGINDFNARMSAHWSQVH